MLMIDVANDNSYEKLIFMYNIIFSGDFNASEKKPMFVEKWLDILNFEWKMSVINISHSIYLHNYISIPTWNDCECISFTFHILFNRVSFFPQKKPPRIVSFCTHSFWFIAPSIRNRKTKERTLYTTQPIILPPFFIHMKLWLCTRSQQSFEHENQIFFRSISQPPFNMHNIIHKPKLESRPKTKHVWNPRFHYAKTVLFALFRHFDCFRSCVKISALERLTMSAFHKSAFVLELGIGRMCPKALAGYWLGMAHFGIRGGGLIYSSRVRGTHKQFVIADIVIVVGCYVVWYC